MDHFGIYCLLFWGGIGSGGGGKEILIVYKNTQLLAYAFLKNKIYPYMFITENELSEKRMHILEIVSNKKYF